MNFEPIMQTDSIIISDNMGKEIRTITDKTKIREITNFVRSQNTGWVTPWAGVPVALVRANFYSGNKFINDFGVGSNFATFQGCGFWQSRKLSAKDRKMIMSLFAVKDPYANK
jgi:hypothetical protein